MLSLCLRVQCVPSLSLQIHNDCNTKHIHPNKASGHVSIRFTGTLHYGAVRFVRWFVRSFFLRPTLTPNHALPCILVRSSTYAAAAALTAPSVTVRQNRSAKAPSARVLVSFSQDWIRILLIRHPGYNRGLSVQIFTTIVGIQKKMLVGVVVEQERCVP